MKRRRHSLRRLARAGSRVAVSILFMQRFFASLGVILGGGTLADQFGVFRGTINELKELCGNSATILLSLGVLAGFLAAYIAGQYLGTAAEDGRYKPRPSGSEAA